jgi:phosphatidate cytidylyltransferase
MKRLLTALVLIPLVLLAVFRLPDPIFIAVVGLIAILATTEYLQIVKSYGYAEFRLTTYSVIAVLYLIVMLIMRTNWISGLLVLVLPAVLLIFAPSAFLVAGMREGDLRRVLPGAAMSFFAVPYIGGSLACIALLRTFTSSGWFFVLFTFFAVWVGDSAAYYVGRSIGRYKFSPRISPKKTWEGAVASVVGAVIVVAIFSHFAPQIESALRRVHLVAELQPVPSYGDVVQPVILTRAPLWIVCLIGALLNIAAQLGDLFESLIKRGAGVKDSGTILPGHGGILDRIDALLFAAPVAFVLFVAFGNKFLVMTVF